MNEQNDTVSRIAAAGEEVALEAMKAGGVTGDEATAYLVRGNLAWHFFKKWLALIGVVGVVTWLWSGIRLGWPATIALVLVVSVVLYILAHVWAKRVFSQHDWVDAKGEYRRVDKR